MQGIKKFWCGITEQAGLDDYRLHDNRHTHASHLVSSGLSLEIVGRLLGHTNPLTTKRYAHLADDPLRAAAERFGSKMDALQDTREADIVPILHEDNEPGSCYATPRIHPSTLATLRSGGVRFGSRNPARLPSLSARDSQAAME